MSQTGSIGGFADNSSVSGYARTAMAWANGAGLISGMGDNTLAPRGTATRGQAAVILMGLDKLWPGCKKFQQISQTGPFPR